MSTFMTLAEYNVMIPDMMHETLETTIVEVLAIPYLSKATQAEAKRDGFGGAWLYPRSKEAHNHSAHCWPSREGPLGFLRGRQYGSLNIPFNTGKQSVSMSQLALGSRLCFLLQHPFRRSKIGKDFDMHGTHAFAFEQVAIVPFATEFRHKFTASHSLYPSCPPIFSISRGTLCFASEEGVLLQRSIF